MKEHSLIVFTDGGARGNPGEAAIGIYITDKNKKNIAGFGKRIGIVTNNVAEYRAVIEALSWIIENKNELDGYKAVYFYMDSNLVCSQINGLFRVKDANLRELLLLLRGHEARISLPIYYSHIPREKNKIADSYVNQALDSKY